MTSVFRFTAYAAQETNEQTVSLPSVSSWAYFWSWRWKFHQNIRFYQPIKHYHILQIQRFVAFWVKYARYLPIFWRTLLPPSSWMAFFMPEDKGSKFVPLKWGKLPRRKCFVRIHWTAFYTFTTVKISELYKKCNEYIFFRCTKTNSSLKTTITVFGI